MEAPNLSRISALASPTRRWLTRRQCLLALVGIVALAIVWYSTPYPRGMVVAGIDQFRGHDEVKVYGMPPPWAWDYAHLLSERYGVKVNEVASCGVSEGLRRYADSYNSVAKPRILARFGKDIFSECENAARAEWETRARLWQQSGRN